jgi:hypothetical protein
MTEQNNPDQLYDNAFYVRRQRWGTFVSYRADTDQSLITSLTEELCIHATRFYLKGLQEGWPEAPDSKTYDSVVGGKL